MFKNRSAIISGHTGSGKSTLIHKYLQYVNKNEHQIIIIDPKGVEFFEYKKDPSIMVIDDDIETKILIDLKKIFEEKIENAEKHTLLIIDECADIFYNKKIIAFVNKILENKLQLKTDVILASQLKSSFKKIKKDYVEAILDLK